jgi:KDO2-lipid IV(A) lauroyltransferase
MRIIGLRLSRYLFSFIFQLIGPIIRKNNIAIKNLLKFQKNLDREKQNEIISKMWSNYGMTFVEYIFLKKFRKRNSHIKIEGEEILDTVLKNKKPVIFISGHFANFELMSMEITKKNINLATIYRPLNNYFLNPLMEYLRVKYICNNQIKKGIGGVKEAINFINKGYSIALMIDQRVSEGEKIEFFNEDALTTTLPAQLALKFNLNIIPIYLERKNSNSFFMKINKPIDLSKFNNKIDISKKLNQILENMIIQNPCQWIWTHNRWK